MAEHKHQEHWRDLSEQDIALLRTLHFRAHMSREDPAAMGKCLQDAGIVRDHSWVRYFSQQLVNQHTANHSYFGHLKNSSIPLPRIGIEHVVLAGQELMYAGTNPTVPLIAQHIGIPVGRLEQLGKTQDFGDLEWDVLLGLASPETHVVEKETQFKGLMVDARELERFINKLMTEYHCVVIRDPAPDLPRPRSKTAAELTAHLQNRLYLIDPFGSYDRAQRDLWEQSMLKVGKQYMKYVIDNNVFRPYKATQGLWWMDHVVEEIMTAKPRFDDLEFIDEIQGLRDTAYGLLNGKGYEDIEFYDSTDQRKIRYADLTPSGKIAVYRQIERNLVAALQAHAEWTVS